MSNHAFNALIKGVHARKQVNHEAAPEVIAHIDAGLIELMPKIKPHRDVLRQVLFSEDASLLSILFEQHGAAFYRDLQLKPQRRVSLSDLLCSSRLDLLRVMHNAGLPVAEERTVIRSALYAEKSDYLLKFYFEDVGKADLLFPRYAHESILNISGKAGAYLGEHLEKMDKDRRIRCVDSIMLRLSTLARMKTLAYALTSGVDLVARSPAEIHFYPRAVQQLMEQSQSAHGRLELKSREPDLKDICSRPYSGTFFGLTDEDLKQ